jgi:hypothetical protein
MPLSMEEKDTATSATITNTTGRPMPACTECARKHIKVAPAWDASTLAEDPVSAGPLSAKYTLQGKRIRYACLVVSASRCFFSIIGMAFWCLGLTNVASAATTPTSAFYTACIKCRRKKTKYMRPNPDAPCTGCVRARYGLIVCFIL